MLVKALNGNSKRICLFVAGICAIGGVVWWYDRALSNATDLNALRRLVLAGLVAICGAAVALALAFWQLGSAAISQQAFPPVSRLVPVLLIVPGDARLSGRDATRRGRVLMGLACGLCVWALIVLLLAGYIDGAATRARSTRTPRAGQRD